MDVVIYIFSWKKVSDNAIQIYDEVSKVYDKVWLLNCDENLKIENRNVIQANDRYYFTKQIYTCLNHLHEYYNKEYAFMNIVGDTNPSADWKSIIERIKYGFDKLNCGIVAPNVEYTGWSHNLEEFKDNYWFVENTDCTAWALHPKIWNFLLKENLEKISYYGWGIDWICIEYSRKIGMNVLRDMNNIVYQPKGTAYPSKKAGLEYKRVRMLWYGKYAKIDF